MEWHELRYEDFFRALAGRSARYLLIGRRALILLGAPVQSLDIDILLSPEREDLEKLLACAQDLRLETPQVDPASPPPFVKLHADNTHVDCFRARGYRTREGEDLLFDDMWRARQTIVLEGVAIPIPSVDDLIRTKRLRREGSPKAAGDEADLRYLLAFKERSTRERA